MLFRAYNLSGLFFRNKTVVALILGSHMFFSSMINICRVPRKLFEHEAARPSCKRLPRDPANINAMEQTCVIVILAFYLIPVSNRTENAGKFLK